MSKLDKRMTQEVSDERPDKRVELETELLDYQSKAQSCRDQYATLIKKEAIFRSDVLRVRLAGFNNGQTFTLV
jgi:hypothetical protein